MKTGRTLQPEGRLSRYRIVGPLGAGGMGEECAKIAGDTSGNYARRAAVPAAFPAIACAIVPARLVPYLRAAGTSDRPPGPGRRVR